MAWAFRWLGVNVIGLSGALLSGCAAVPDWALPQKSFANDIAPESQGPRVARLQATEGATPDLPKPPPRGIGLPVIGMPTPLTSSTMSVLGLPSPPPSYGSGVAQTSLTTRGTVRVSVRAWVNGHPIFDDELMQAVGSDLRRIQFLPEPAKTQEFEKTMNAVLEGIIDSEVMYQEAMKRIEKSQPHMVQKLKDVVEEEFDKQRGKMREAKIPEEYIKEMEPTAKRLLERNLIATEFARSSIMDRTKVQFNFREIRDYYEDHKNEFQSVDKVVWQDIFIPVSPTMPRVQDVQRFAEEEIAKCRKPDDFNRLMMYNEGDSKLRNGEGLGQRRGEIRPSELETALFQLQEGVIGPVIPFPTGVHVVRVLKREYAGQLPLDDQTQTNIRRKLENQFADREYKRLIRELRARAVVSIVRAGT